MTVMRVDAISINRQFLFFGPVATRPVEAVVKRGLVLHEVPVFTLGRQAVDKWLHRQGLGGQLLLAAGRRRCLYVAVEAGGVALLIDAKNERVSRAYASYGALSASSVFDVLRYPPSGHLEESAV